ncbi:acyl-CoA dehydrogenase family protein [Phaeobacter sp. NW0010-22]|uniref:acyl-CoA dehydrogenase family protein n=1 Tax=Phaeobacter sp. NW0010-22 TaxID=3135907 RepID=UPI00334002DB
MRNRASAFARCYIFENAEQWERDRSYPHEVVKLASKGFGGFLVSNELGGNGGTATDFLMMVEEFAKAGIGCFQT